MVSSLETVVRTKGEPPNVGIVLTERDGMERAQAMTQLVPFPFWSTGIPSSSVEMAVEVKKVKKESISVEFGSVERTWEWRGDEDVVG